MHRVYSPSIINNVNYLAFFVIIVFIFFDGIRSNIVYNEYFSMIREGSLLYLILMTSLSCNIKKRLIGYSVILFISYHLLVSFFSFLLEGRVEIGFIVKPIEFVCAIYMFYYYEELTLRRRHRLYKQVIYVAIVFSIINTLLYFIPLPIWNRQEFWWGRISCGYPTMDVVSLCYALVLLLYKPNLIKKTWKKLTFSLIIIIEILLNFSGTGIALLPLCLLPLIITTKVTIRNMVLLTLSILIFVGAFFFVQKRFPDELKAGMALIENKLAIMGGDDNVMNNTLKLRKQQFASVENRHDDVTRIVGLGLNNLTMDLDRIGKDHYAYSIENQYDTILMGYGYVGFALYLLMMVEYLLLIVYLPVISFIHKCMLILFIAIWAANSYTIITLMIFPNMAFLALNLSGIFRLNKQLVIYKNPLVAKALVIGAIKWMLTNEKDGHSYRLPLHR